MSDIIYDIFISYRRDGGFETAKHLNDLLCHDGYSVSFDIDTLREGDFDKALLARIEQCVDFVLIVDKHCFDKTLDDNVKPEQDWLRTELAYALKLKKNVIPVLLANAEFPDGLSDRLPDDIKDVTRKNGPGYSREYFDTFYGKLKEMLHARPRYSVVNGGMQNESNSAYLKVKSNLDCVMYVDEEEKAHIKANKLEKIRLSPGDYMLKFESVEKGEDCVVEDEFTMPNKDKLYKVDLLIIKQERETAERKEKEQQEKQLKLKSVGQEMFEQVSSLVISASRKLKSVGQESLEQEHQEELVRVRGERDRLVRERRAQELRGEFETRGIKFKMVKVEGGSFLMGVPKGQWKDSFEQKMQAQQVSLCDYYIGETAVTQGLWKAVMGFNPSQFYGDDNLPVENMYYNDVQEFIERLNNDTGRHFRLPTEAEWEYAALGGNKSKGFMYSGSNTLDEVAWYYKNSKVKTHPVKMKKANELGIFDMSGNVWEWCTDRNSNAKDYSMVIRGGSFFSRAKHCTVLNRSFDNPLASHRYLGFRLVMEA